MFLKAFFYVIHVFFFLDALDFNPTPHVKQLHVWLTVPDLVNVEIIFQIPCEIKTIGLPTKTYLIICIKHVNFYHAITYNINLLGKKNHAKNQTRKKEGRKMVLLEY